MIKNNIPEVHLTKREQIRLPESYIECIHEINVRKIKKHSKHKPLKKIQKNTKRKEN